MSSCLYDIVTLRGVCDTASADALYINDLPGVELRDFSALTTAEDATVADLWNKVQRRAIGSFVDRITNKIRAEHKMQLGRVSSRISTGEWHQPFESLSGESKYKGVLVFLNSDFMQIRLHEARLYVGNAPVNSSIKVWDAETGEELDSIAFTVDSNGFATISVNKAYSAKCVFIAYDASEVTSRKVSFNGLSYYESNCSNQGGMYNYSRRAEINKTQEPIEYNLTSGDGDGLILSYSIECSLDAWICENKTALARPLLYLLGEEFFTEVAASDSIDRTTLMPSGQLAELINYCKINYEKSFNSFIKGAAGSLKDAYCFECKAKFKRKTITL